MCWTEVSCRKDLKLTAHDRPSTRCGQLEDPTLFTILRPNYSLNSRYCRAGFGRVEPFTKSSLGRLSIYWRRLCLEITQEMHSSAQQSDHKRFSHDIFTTLQQLAWDHMVRVLYDILQSIIRHSDVAVTGRKVKTLIVACGQQNPAPTPFP